MLLFALLLPHGVWNNVHIYRVCKFVCLLDFYQGVYKLRKDNGSVHAHLCIFLKALSSCIASNLEYTYRKGKINRNNIEKK